MPLSPRVLILLSLLFVSSCRLDDCGVFLHHASSYSGQSTAAAPYLEKVTGYTLTYSCGSNNCTAHTVTVLALHNPTGNKVRGSVTCRYTALDYQQRVRPSPVVVPARSTRLVELGVLVLVGTDLAPVSVACEAGFQ
jgi:hypothetical protein